MQRLLTCIIENKYQTECAEYRNPKDILKNSKINSQNLEEKETCTQNDLAMAKDGITYLFNDIIIFRMRILHLISLGLQGSNSFIDKRCVHLLAKSQVTGHASSPLKHLQTHPTFVSADKAKEKVPGTCCKIN